MKKRVFECRQEYCPYKLCIGENCEYLKRKPVYHHKKGKSPIRMDRYKDRKYCSSSICDSAICIGNKCGHYIKFEDRK